MFAWFFRKNKIDKYNKANSIQNTKSCDKNFDNIMNYIENGHNVFITGGAGVGKSYILNKLKEKYNEELNITSKLVYLQSILVVKHYILGRYWICK